MNMVTDQKKNNSEKPDSIIVGVTGHRDIDKEQKLQLKTKVCEILSEIKNNNSDSRVVVMSGMAIGADMICAEAAIEMNCTLSAALPMEVSEFRKDFSAEDVQDFDRLIAQTDEIFSVTECFSDKLPRTSYYVKLGEYLVEHSNILLALWDGDEKHCLPGGTTDVVRMAHEKNKKDAEGFGDKKSSLTILNIVVQRA